MRDQFHPLPVSLPVMAGICAVSGEAMLMRDVDTIGGYLPLRS